MLPVALGSSTAPHVSLTRAQCNPTQCHLAMERLLFAKWESPWVEQADAVLSLVFGDSLCL